MNAPAPRRVLVVIDEMEVGGSQRQIAHLLGGMDRTRWLPELMYFRKPSFLVDGLCAAGVPVHHLAKKRRFDPGFLLRYARWLRRGRYDLVHAFSLTAELWTVIARGTMRHPPALVSSVRSLNLDAPAWQWRAKRFVLRHSAATIANASAAADVVSRRARVPRESIDVINNGVALPEPMTASDRLALRESLQVPSGRVFALFVGRLITVKNLPCLLDALAALPQGSRPWLAIAGSGPRRGELEAQRLALALGNDVRFLGERADATRLMQVADFLVLCSDQEGLSNALLESMAAGCPVIASEVGGNPELVQHGVSGLLFPAGDREALAAALALLTADAPLRERLARQAFDLAKRQHAIERLVGRTEQVYERCTTGGAGKAATTMVDAGCGR